MRLLVVCACFSLAMCPVQAATLSAAQRVAALHAIEAAIQTTYVFPALRAPLVAKLDEAFAGHRYDTTDPDLFAARIGEDLQAVSHDGHLYIDNDPGEYAAMLAPPKSDAGIDARRRQTAIRDHSGLTRMDILPGNIRYLKITGFQWTPGLTPKAYDAASLFLKDGDAVIVDLRENGGGNSDAADLFDKAFVAPNRGKPIYILVDGHVASAAEAVAYGVQQEKRATIIGSATYGAANNNKKFPIAPSFVLSVSYNRPLNPISHSNWEGTGVIPDIAVPGSQALERAELDALDRLGARATGDTLAEYRWARTGLEARLHPVTLPRATLQACVGRYGTITLRLAEDGLRLSRRDRPRWEQDVLLTPLDTDGTFGVASFDDLRIRLDAKTLTLLHGSEDAREEFPRAP